jgi:RNA polymerase sigma factor (sigma-70 family)
MKDSSEELLAAYAERRTDEVFRELVRRHIGLVYNTALRVANGDAHLAQDVAQTVFTDLARKAATISSGTVVSGWLYQHTWFTASKMIRTERRRQMREQTTIDMQSSTTTNTADERELQSALDDALTSLKPEERDAVVLRYFEQAELRRIGALFGISEDAAQKRVARAVEKLRDVFAARGLTVSVTALTAFLSSQSLAAPPSLAGFVSSTALVAASSTAVGVTAFLASTKGKLAIAAACAIAAGTPVLWQQQKISALNAELGRMSALVTSNELLRAEIERLRGETLSAAEREEMNRRFLELQRLRGEVTLLRNERATKARAAENTSDSAEEKPDVPEVLQIAIQGRVVELSHERMSELLKSGFPPVADEKNFNLKLEGATATAVFALLEKSEGVDILSAPRVTTVDGREARVSVTDELGLPDGTSLPLGLEVGFVPTVLPDKESTHLKIDLKTTEFLGWENESKTVPRFRTRNVEHQETLGPGEVLLLGRSVVVGEGESRETKLQIYSFGADLIDAAGNLLRRRENKN